MSQPEHRIECPTCEGSGGLDPRRMDPGIVCETCDGAGWVCEGCGEPLDEVGVQDHECEWLTTPSGPWASDIDPLP